MSSFNPATLFVEADFRDIPDGHTPTGSPADYQSVWPLPGAFGNLESEEMAHWLLVAWQTQPHWQAIHWRPVANVLHYQYRAGREHWLPVGIILAGLEPREAVLKGLNHLLDVGYIERLDTETGTFVYPTVLFLERMAPYRVTAHS